MGRLLLLLALLCAAPASAQDAAVPLPAVDVPVPDEEASPQSVTRTSPSGLVTLVDTAAHRGEAKDTAELLAPTPGAVLSDAGGVGQRKSLSLRGAGSTGVMVLLDGIPLTSPGTSVDLSRIPATLTERLEVLRGAASARYGPGALGGVVNLVTRRPTHGVSLTAEATWGNFGTALASASASGALWGGDGLVLLHGARSSGDFGFLKDEQPALDGNTLTPMVRANNQASAGGALLRYRTELSSRWSLDILGEGGADTRRLAGTAQNPTADASQDAAHGLLGARLTRRFEGGGELSALGWGRLEDSTLLGSPFGAGPWRQTESAAGVDLAYSQLVFGRHGISAAASLSADWLRAPHGTSASWVRAGVMLGDEIFFFDGQLAVNATVRVDQSGPFTGVSPRAGALVLLPKGFELRLNAGQAHRPPTFLELYVMQGHLAPNPNLRPERGLFADAAIALRHERAFVQLGAFGALYEDLISYEYYPPLLARPYNFQAARVLGLELEGTWAPTDWLSLAGSYTLLSTQNLKDDQRYYLKTLPYRPRHKLHARASVGPRWLRARGEVLWQSEQFTNRTETVALGARAFVNLGLVLQPVSTPSTTVAIAFELKNLLDVTSQDLDDYPLPSRGAYLTLSVAWDDSSSTLPAIASLSTSPKENSP
jgi:vitamin B12 transporter